LPRENGGTLTTSDDRRKRVSRSLDFVVTRMGFFDADDGHLVFEQPIAPGDLRLSGQFRGEPSVDGRMDGQFAGFQDGNALPQSTLTCLASIRGFEAKGKGRPTTRNRDIALSLAVGYHQFLADHYGEKRSLDAIYEELAKDVKWRLVSHERDAEYGSLAKACLRGDKILKTECFGAVPIEVEFVPGEVGLIAFALVKKNGKLETVGDGGVVYEGYPWAWAPGLYEVLTWEHFRPLKIFM
jgi:hypothetical protein